MHFLVVAHEAKVAKLISDILNSHQHSARLVHSVEVARHYYMHEDIDAAIIDMPLPMNDDSRIRRENGRNLIRSMRSFETTKHVPIIAIAQSKVCDLDFVISIMKRGRKHEAYIDCVVDSLTNDRLDNALETLVHYHQRSLSSQPDQVHTRSRVLTIEDEAIKVSGITVWHYTECDDLRQAVLALSQSDEHGYVRLKGTALNEYLGRNISNSISTLINRFKKECARILTENGMVCGQHDIIGPAKNGGYHLQPHIIVEKQADADDAMYVEASSTPSSGLSEIACRILHMIREEDDLMQKDFIERFAHLGSASTVKRAIARLRAQGLITSNKQHFYQLSAEAAQVPS